MGQRSVGSYVNFVTKTVNVQSVNLAPFVVKTNMFFSNVATLVHFLNLQHTWRPQKERIRPGSGRIRIMLVQGASLNHHIFFQNCFKCAQCAKCCKCFARPGPPWGLSPGVVSISEGFTLPLKIKSSVTR